MHKPPTNVQRFFARRWPLLLITFIWFAVFLPMMSGQTVVAFRDSAYLYYPLFKWIDSVWASGHLPLWNPYDNYGVPVVADGSSSVFYPGKLIFFARILSFEARYGIYLAIHIWIAAMGAYRFARQLRCSRAGSTVAGFSYAFGGSVLFQVTNVIYLVSSAWLPFALASVWRLQKTNRPIWALNTGVFCSLMILGGDPQMTYHVGLIAATTLFFAWLRRRRNTGGTRVRQSAIQQAIWPLVNLGVIVAVTTALSAIQLLPSMEYARVSERAHFTAPRNIYEAISTLDLETASFDQATRGMLNQPFTETHLDHVYQFSQPPWSLTELLWPNVSGRPFPTHQRWASALPGADRMWTPTLYVGCLTFLLALMGVNFFGKPRTRAWVTHWTFFFAIASFGWYGIVWALRELSGDPAMLGAKANYVGGFYWLMMIALPKYVMFRYPAKLFVIASLGICLLAGLSFSQIQRTRSTQTLRKFYLLLSSSLVLTLLAAVLLQTDEVKEFFGVISFDPIWGPFQDQAALTSLLYALAHTSISFISFAVLLSLGKHPKSGNYLAAAVILLVCIDVLVANRYLTIETDSAAFREARVAEDIEFLPRYPTGWSVNTSEQRIEELVAWQQQVAFPKWHLLIPKRHIRSFSSIRPVNDIAAGIMTSFLHPAEPTDSLRSDLEFLELPLDKAFYRYLKSSSAFVNQVLEKKHQLAGTRVKDYRDILQMEVTSQSAKYEIDASNERLYLCTSMLWDENWTARILDLEGNVVDNHPIIEPWLYVFAAVKVPKGQHLVELRYRPKSFYRGAAISGIGWSLLGVMGVIGLRRRKRGGANATETSSTLQAGTQ